MEEILTGIRGEPQFRKKCQNGFLSLSLFHKFDDPGSIKGRVGYAHFGSPHGDPDKAVVVEVKKVRIFLHGFALRDGLWPIFQRRAISRLAAGIVRASDGIQGQWMRRSK